MIKKIEAHTLEEAYNNASSLFNCSITELSVEVIQSPRAGFLGFFAKKAIIVAALKTQVKVEIPSKEETPLQEEKPKVQKKEPKPKKEPREKPELKEKKVEHTILNDTIMPESFVSDQDDDYDVGNALEFTADYDDVFDENHDEDENLTDIAIVAKEVSKEINKLFDLTCFSIDKVDVSVYDEETLLVEFRGEDAALLIGKEGYRYKALSYMIFNWVNSKYQVQLRLEIAEFLKNQEESVSRYLTNVYENIERDGRAQTKILDGVLVQIALKELREKYPEKYVVIRSTRDGLKYIIINDYHSN